MPTALPSRERLFHVSEAPRFLCDSGPTGWDGAFFTSIVSAPAGRVDHLHERFCLVRKFDSTEVKHARCPRWELLPAGIHVWVPGDEHRGEWRGSSRAQFLFIADDRAARVLDDGPVRPRTLSPGAVQSLVPNLIFDALEADLVQGSPAGPLVGDALITALVAQLAALPEPRRERLSPAIRNRVLEYMNAQMARPLHLADLANVAGIGVRQFSRAFFASTGESPHQYLLRCRIERAKTLIAAGLPLSDIAQHCGFSDQSQFTRTFARRVGVTPARYRAALRG